MSEKDRIKKKKIAQKKQNKELEVINNKKYIAKLTILYNVMGTGVASLLIFVFLFFPGKFGRTTLCKIETVEGLIIFLVLISIPIIVTIITAIWSHLKIRKYDKEIVDKNITGSNNS